MKDARDALMVGRATDGRVVRRPLSPHLQVYRPQISSALSIFHRLTGVALSAGTLLLVWWLVAAATSDEAWDEVQGVVGSPLGMVVLFGWTVALTYHFFAGIRHLFWDAGYGFEKADFHRSGYAVLAATVVCSVAVWAVGLSLRY